MTRRSVRLVKLHNSDPRIRTRARVLLFIKLLPTVEPVQGQPGNCPGPVKEVEECETQTGFVAGPPAVLLGTGRPEQPPGCAYHIMVAHFLFLGVKLLESGQ